jgi:protein ImuA
MVRTSPEKSDFRTSLSGTLKPDFLPSPRWNGRDNAAAAPSSDTADTVAKLRRLLDDYQDARRAAAAGRAKGKLPEGLPTGWRAMDAALPDGVAPGSLIECLCDWPGAGALQIALGWSVAAAERLSAGNLDPHIVFVDGDGDFYPPAAAAWGVDLARLVIIRPASPADAFWAAEQCLRCDALSGVVATLGRLDETQSRRLQLAAEAGCGLGVIVRPLQRSGKSFATVRLVVEPVSGESASGGPVSGGPVSGGPVLGGPAFRPVSSSAVHRRAKVSLVRIREGMPAGPLEVELPDEALARIVSAVPAVGAGTGGGRIALGGAAG